MSEYYVYFEISSNPDVSVTYWFESLVAAKAFVFDSIDFWKSPDLVHVGIMTFDGDHEKLVICNY